MMMIQLCVLYLIIIFIFDSAFADPDLTLIFETKKGNTYNANCVIGKNALKTGIFWTDDNGEPLTINSTSTYIPNRFQTDFTERRNYNLWTVSDWSIGESITKQFGPVLDERWEMFQTKKLMNKADDVWNGKKFESVSVSVFISNVDYRIYIGDGYYMQIDSDEISVKQKGVNDEISSTRIINSKEVWLHFAITKIKTAMKVTFFPNRETVKWKINKSDNIDTVKISKGIQYRNSMIPGFWKLHEYNYLYSEKSSETLDQIGTPINHNGKLCIALFVAVCDSCSLGIKLSVDKKPFPRLINVTAEQNDHYLWQRIVIEEDKHVSNTIKLFLHKTNTQGFNGFWAIDDIRLCDRSEVRMASVSRHSISNTSCQSLAHKGFNVSGSDVGLGHLTCPAGHLGESCNINCEAIFQKDNYCGNTICTSNGCTCSWGFYEENCSKECDSSTWGEKCNHTCGECKNYDICNRFNGICPNGCEKPYTGNKCAVLLPILMDKPKLVNIFHTKIEIEINKKYRGTYVPKNILLQYREQNTKEWQTFREVDFTDQTEKYVITNLKAATTYDIRAVLTTDEGSLDTDEDTPIQSGVRTTCKDIITDNINIKTGRNNATITINIEDLTSPYCSLKEYTIKILEDSWDNSIQSSEPIIIRDLLPYTNYTIIFSNRITNLSIAKPFRTKSISPGKVSNITYVRFSENISLFWNAPKRTGDELNYKITYKLVGHVACESNITKDSYIDKQEDTKAENIVLKPLSAYSYYEISIHATNEAGDGEKEVITVATQKSDDLSGEELPTGTPIINGEIQINPPSCEKVKGPLDYIINYIYTDNLLCIKEPKHFSTTVPYSNTIKMTSPELTPYSNYLVTIQARRNKIKFLKSRLEIPYKSKPSAPSAVRNLTVYCKNESHVWLRWIAPCPSNGQLEQYTVDVNNINTKIIKITCLWENVTCAVIENLTKSQIYRFGVQAKNKNVAAYGTVNEARAKTIVEPSDPPNSLTHTFEEDQLSLTWSHPDITNGPLLKFKIDGYIMETSCKKIAQNISEEYEVKKDQLWYNKKLNVTPATVFNIRVAANNSMKGKPAFIQVIVPPPKPTLSSFPGIRSCSEGTCSIKIPSPEVCVNCTFYLVVSTERNENIISPFQPFPFYENIRRNNENIKILQSEHWIAANNSFMDGVESIYIGKKVAQREVYNDTNYSIHIILVSSYKGKYNTNTYILHYGIIEEGKVNGLYYLLLLLVIPLAVLVFFIYRFWGKNKVVSNKVIQSTNVNLPLKQNAEQIAEDTYPLMNLPPVPPKQGSLRKTNYKYSKVIELNNLKSYLRETAEGDKNNCQLSKQHEMCNSGYIKPTEIGSMAINKKKNRYKDLIAYDHTRVKLKCPDENGSDYINANYVDGYNIKKAYIATQGPKANTVDDFWHMVWEHNVCHIVMLANVIENGKKKCEEYWPAFNHIKKFQDISVQNIKTSVFSTYIYRELQVTHKGNKRIVNHLHFTLWPDHGVPLYPQNLVPFMKEMLKIPQGKHPIVVHCSAGIGRTGTILLCDIVLRMAALEQKVDFFRTYHQLREHRPKMVDNPAQYILAHLVVYECLFGKDFSVSFDGNFKNKMDNLLTDSSITSIMDYLEEINWQIKIMQECFDNELLDVNKDKNRFLSILPGCSQIYLERYPQDDESSDYINAVSMDCFQNQGRFIVTQQPLPNTIGDFWRLILQYNVSTIVSLNEIQRRDQTSCIFWPRRNESFYPVDYIKVAYQSEEDRGDFSVITVGITIKNEDERRCVNIICLNGWMPETSPTADPTGLLAIRDYMFNTTFGQENPIVVTCYDGARASGLFVALSFLIEKIKLEHTCDIVLAVSTVRQRRMECIREKEQIKFLLKAASLYVESFQTYSNFDNQ